MERGIISTVLIRLLQKPWPSQSGTVDAAGLGLTIRCIGAWWVQTTARLGQIDGSLSNGGRKGTRKWRRRSWADLPMRSKWGPRVRVAGKLSGAVEQDDWLRVRLDRRL